MKKYISPKTKAITLVPEQAILEVCQISGFYFDMSTHCTGTVTTHGPGWCTQTVRGRPTGASGGFIRENMPS
ncbi:MAG: hypothetical protein PHQ52_04060 [Candidatus Omnitrophica bacterium]|nr:hypothetical protein [Candidatus Omnitrophota bacterium]